MTRLFATDGWTDPGEAAALAAVGVRRRGRVLDLGVGGGRTTGLLAPTARSYIGLDLAPEMITLARSRFPDADLRVGNARDVATMAELPDHGFDLIVWSFNGLDTLAHDDRATALAGMAKVLAPHGRVVFSSLNLDGISYDERPWWLARPTSRRARRYALTLARHPSRLIRSLRNYRTTRHRAVDGDRWGMRPMRAHEFRFVVHFATVGEVVREAAAAGLVVESAWADDGAWIDPATAGSAADYVHYVCAPAGG